jgi:hypothetical protein
MRVIWIFIAAIVGLVIYAIATEPKALCVHPGIGMLPRQVYLDAPASAATLFTQPGDQTIGPFYV